MKHIANVFSLHSLQDISHLLYCQSGVFLFKDLKDCVHTAGGSGDLLQCFIWNVDVSP